MRNIDMFQTPISDWATLAAFYSLFWNPKKQKQTWPKHTHDTYFSFNTFLRVLSGFDVLSVVTDPTGAYKNTIKQVQTEEA